MAKNTVFYAECKDFNDLVSLFQSVADVHYYKTGSFTSAHIPHYNSLLELQELGIAKTGDWIHNDSFLILPSSVEISIRTASQRDGGERYLVDQKENPSSIVLRVGGIHSSNAVIASSIGTVHSTPEAAVLFKVFSKGFKKYVKIKGIPIGPNTFPLFGTHYRFTQNTKSSIEYDLKE